MPRNKVPGKPRGRMTAYAYFVQACREELKKRHPDQAVAFTEFSRSCAQRWKAMSAQEKAPFQNQAEVDKQRFNAEMRTYVPQDAGRKRGGKRKRSKDPNAPKRSLSAFFWFCNDERPKIRGMNPEYTVGDVAKELGRMWAQVDGQTRERYNLMAERDKQRYQREMEGYKNNKKAGGRGAAPAPVPQYEAEESDEESEEEDDE